LLLISLLPKLSYILSTSFVKTEVPVKDEVIKAKGSFLAGWLRRDHPLIAGERGSNAFHSPFIFSW